MPTKQEGAPGDLELVRAFVNSAHLDDGEDELRSPASLAQWLKERGLIPDGTRATRPDVRSAVGLRESLRAVLLAHTEGASPPAEAWQEIDQAAERVRLRVYFRPDGSALLEPSVRGIDRGLGRLLAIVYDAITDGSWQRLKACRDLSCQWAFYDHTKNRSGSWCSMEVCGNRAKARAHRQRTRRP